MDKLKEVIRQIAQEHGLECGEEEINACAYLAISHAATHRDMLAVLKNNQIETDDVIEKEYVYLLYAILKRFAAMKSDDMSILLLACMKAIYAEQAQDTNKMHAFYLEKKTEIEEVEEEHGSGGGIGYALVNSNCKFFDEDTAVQISREQAVSIKKYLLNTIEKYGLQNWVEKDSVAGNVPEKRENSPAATGREKTVKRKRTPLEVFHDSAQLCVLRNQLLKRIDDRNNKLNRHYDEDEKYATTYYANLVPAGYRAKSIIIVWFVSLIISTIFDIPLLALFATVGSIAVFMMLRNHDQNEAKQAALQASSVVHDLRLEQEKNKAEWETELKEYSDMLENVTGMLKDLIKIGGIPEVHWGIAQELWNYVELKAADSLKEAIVLYRDAKNQETMTIALNEIQRQNQILLKQVTDLTEKQAEMARNMDRLELNQQMLALNALYDWPPAEIIALNML